MKTRELLYGKISTIIERQIEKGTLNSGDKMLSLRELSKIYGVSQSTALKVYSVLMDKDLIESRPQSGYYVSYQNKPVSLPKTTRPHMRAGDEQIEDLIAEVYNDKSAPGITMLSLATLDAKLIPVARLNKGLMEAMRKLKNFGIEYESVQGHEKLRKQVARRSSPLQSSISTHDIITMSGCSHALFCCLSAITKP